MDEADILALITQLWATQFWRNQQYILDKMSVRVRDFGREQSLNAYRRAKLANAFRWHLNDAGYDKQYVDNNSPRGVLRTKATDVDDPTVQPHWGRVGKQTIEDTGPLTRKRMETIDDETTAAAIDYMGRQVQTDRPFSFG